MFSIDANLLCVQRSTHTEPRHPRGKITRSSQLTRLTVSQPCFMVQDKVDFIHGLLWSIVLLFQVSVSCCGFTYCLLFSALNREAPRAASFLPSSASCEYPEEALRVASLCATFHRARLSTACASQCRYREGRSCEQPCPSFCVPCPSRRLRSCPPCSASVGLDLPAFSLFQTTRVRFALASGARAPGESREQSFVFFPPC